MNNTQKTSTVKPPNTAPLFTADPQIPVPHVAALGGSTGQWIVPIPLYDVTLPLYDVTIPLYDVTTNSISPQFSNYRDTVCLPRKFFPWITGGNKRSRLTNLNVQCGCTIHVPPVGEWSCLFVRDGSRYAAQALLPQYWHSPYLIYPWHTSNKPHPSTQWVMTHL